MFFLFEVTLDVAVSIFAVVNKKRREEVVPVCCRDTGGPTVVGLSWRPTASNFPEVS